LLRSTNASLTAQVHTLTTRLEASDAEHVLITSSLIQLKLANQSLTDANESLKMQVAELQSIVESQPAEVEGRLRQEMDRIMQRNIEVQNENRALEEGVEEMERELVKAKVEWAEMSGEVEGMRKKWGAISALMNGK